VENYNTFIDELFSLKLETTEYFVRNGKILYPHHNHPLPDHYPTNTPDELLPGTKGTFLSLEHYSNHQNTNRYTDELSRLRRRALNDLSILEPQQVKRILIDANKKHEQLRNLLKNAIEYQKAWSSFTLDQLPECFLELHILNSFVISSRHTASPHLYFARYLVKAITCKKGELSALIKESSFLIDAPTPTGGPLKDEMKYSCFTDLFINPSEVNYCIQALRNYRPEKPVLGEGLAWTASIKDKGLIVAWIERMETMEPKKIKRLSNRKELVKLLNAYFEDLEMGKDARVFSEIVDPTLQDAFKALLPK
jgi:hypothetical protein